jgi:hypothetical protein
MDVGGAWERLLHTPATWIVVAVVLFVVAVVLLVAGARAGRAGRAQRGSVAAAPAGAGSGAAADDAGAPDAEDDDPVTEPSVPRRGPAPSGAVEGPVEQDTAQAVDQDAEDPVTEPAAPRAAAVPDRSDDPAPERLPDGPDAAAHRLLGVLVDDPSAAVAGVAALERGEEPGAAAVALLRSGVPAAAVARLCGVDADDLGDLVAAALGILPDRAAPVVAAEPSEREQVSL